MVIDHAVTLRRGSRTAGSRGDQAIVVRPDRPEVVADRVVGDGRRLDIVRIPQPLNMSSASSRSATAGPCSAERSPTEDLAGIRRHRPRSVVAFARAMA